MRNIFLCLIIAGLCGASIGGTWYFLQNKMGILDSDLQSQIVVLQQEQNQLKLQIGILENTNAQLKQDKDTLSKEYIELTDTYKQLIESENNQYNIANLALESENLQEAKNKFEEFKKLYPTSALLTEVDKKLLLISDKQNIIESSQKLPIEIMSHKMEMGGYFNHQNYANVEYKNISTLMISEVHFKILAFDENGYPEKTNEYQKDKSNILSAYSTNNFPPDKIVTSSWELPELVKRVKVNINKVVFYDAPEWQNPNITRWIEAEKGRYSIQ